MELADIAAIRILAAHWELVGKDAYREGQVRGYNSETARARRLLDHAIKHLRMGAREKLHFKNRMYRESGRPQDSTPLWR